MTRTHIVVAHGGVWNRTADKYENGVLEYVRIPQDGLTYNSLLGIIGKAIDSVNSSDVMIYSFMEAADGNNLRIKIKDDDDLIHVVEGTDILKFYVTPTFSSNHVAISENNFMDRSFVSLLNAQNSVMQHKQTGYMPQNETVNVVNGSVMSDTLMKDIERYDNIVDWGRSSNFEDEDSDDAWKFNSIDVDDDDGGCGIDVANKVLQPSSVTSCGGEDVQDDMQIAATTHMRECVIGRADFHMSIPTTALDIDVRTGDEVCVGATFKSKEELHTALGLYHMVNHVEYRSPRSSKVRFTAICKQNEECSFLLRAVCRGSIWRVIKFRTPHTCQLDLSRQSPRTISSLVVAKYFAPNLLNEAVILKPKDMQSQLQRQYGVVVTYGRALAAENHATRMVYGYHDKSFQVLPSYLYMLGKSNPGSIVDLQIDEEGRFKYAFMALAASITGFGSCGRPVIVVDGTHLKGKYKGVMYVTATTDGNNQIFPLAVGIGDKECNEAWIWFLTQVRKAFGCHDELLIVSDQHITIKNVVECVYPGVPHGLCTYHLQGKLSRWGADVVAMYKKCVYAYQTQEFDKHMNQILSVSEEGAYKKLMKIDPIQWARCKCPVRRYDFLTSNIVESLNNVFRFARKLPICSLLESVRTLIGHWSVERHKNAVARKHELTEYAANKLLANCESGRTMIVEPVSVSKYKVSCGMKHYIVDLVGKQCSCREFDLDVILCSHAAAAISKGNHSLYAHVSNYYKTETLRRMWSNEVMPILHEEEWDVPLSICSTVVRSPCNPRQAGRPRTSRIRSRSESSCRTNSKACSRCKKSCHNRLNCAEYIPFAEGSLIGSSETVNVVRSSGKRRQKSCSTCHVSGHTRTTCPQRPPKE